VGSSAEYRKMIIGLGNRKVSNDLAEQISMGGSLVNPPGVNLGRMGSE
jgi:hypothetical protein